MPSDQSDVSIDCYVRASTLVEPINTTIKTLRDYNQLGALAELTVEAWPAEVPLTDEGDASEIVARYRRFQRWADTHGVDIQPAFTIRDQTTLLSDTPETVLVLPMMCLVIYLNERLVSVVPHSTDLTTYTVGDVLTDLEEFERSPTPVHPATDAAPNHQDNSLTAEHPFDQCPVCGDASRIGHKEDTSRWRSIPSLERGTDNNSEDR